MFQQEGKTEILQQKDTHFDTGCNRPVFLVENPAVPVPARSPNVGLAFPKHSLCHGFVSNAGLIIRNLVQ